MTFLIAIFAIEYAVGCGHLRSAELQLRIPIQTTFFFRIQNPNIEANVSGTYVTDITHFLDDSGELVSEMPAEARKLASFLVLLIDEATAEPTPSQIVSTIRCRRKGCKGLIEVAVPEAESTVNWHCGQCDHHGTISRWQGTKWDNRRVPK